VSTHDGLAGGTTGQRDRAALLWWRPTTSRLIDSPPVNNEDLLMPVVRCGWSNEWRLFTLLRVASLETLNEQVAALAAHGQETTAILGYRDLPSVNECSAASALWFIALWRWNDAWHRASPIDRQAYDVDVDEAFAWGHAHGVATLGRYNCSWSSSWDYFTVWRVPHDQVLDECMHRLGAQRDWRFAQSRHFIGRAGMGGGA